MLLARTRHTNMIPETIAVYVGTQQGIGHIPDLRLFNLVVPLGHHPVGSTLTDTTILNLLRHGPK